MAEVNVEEIMREIHQKAAKMQLKEPVQFDDILVLEEEMEDSQGWTEFDPIRYENNLAAMNETWKVPYYKDMTGNALVVFVKRIIRKITRCSVEHVAEDATIFNTYCVRVINDLTIRLQEQQKINEENCKRIAALERQAANSKN